MVQLMINRVKDKIKKMSIIKTETSSDNQTTNQRLLKMKTRNLMLTNPICGLKMNSHSYFKTDEQINDRNLNYTTEDIAKKQTLHKQNKTTTQKLESNASRTLLNGPILKSKIMTALLFLLSSITLVALFLGQPSEARMNIIAPTPPNQCK